MRKVFAIVTLFLTYISITHGQSDATGLDVAVSIPPQKWVCQKLAGTHVKTEVLVARGQDPHTFEPTPKQLATLLKAKLYFTLGLEFESQVLKKINQTSSKLRIVDTSLPEVEERAEYGQKENGHEHGDHQDEHQHLTHRGEDPHIWLSPLHLQGIAKIMAEAMITADPGNTKIYEKNLHLLLIELDGLHSTIRRQLAPFKGASFYVFHPSFGQFATTYGLVQEAVEVEGKSPTPKQLAGLITRAKKEKVKVIFVQPQFDTKSAEAVAAAIDGEVVPLDALAEDVDGNLVLMSEKIVAALSEKGR